MPPLDPGLDPATRSTGKDPYALHRVALAPFQSAQGASHSLQDLAQDIARIGEARFLSFLLDSGLGPMWCDVVEDLESRDAFSPHFAASLKKEQFNAIAVYLLQKDALTEIDHIFEGAGIAYAVFKGVQVREVLYEVPGKRPSTDIDVLVRKEQCAAAISALRKAGFVFHPVAENISHEATLSKGRISIDLHWEIMRPDRTRIDLTEGMVGRSNIAGGFRVLSETDCLLVLLVHPVFTKYLTAPTAGLVRLVDLHRWIESREVDWDAVIEMAHTAQVRTAAWMTLYWLQMMIPSRVPESILRRLAPGPIRRKYLRHWIRNDYSTRFINRPMLIKGGFTLPAHDSPVGALVFLSSLLREKRKAESITRELEKTTTESDTT